MFLFMFVAGIIAVSKPNAEASAKRCSRRLIARTSHATPTSPHMTTP